MMAGDDGRIDDGIAHQLMQCKLDSGTTNTREDRERKDSSNGDTEIV